MSVPALDVVIVNWNAIGHLPACVAALRAARRQSYTLARIIVVDNASGDGSAEWLARQPDCTLLRNPDNRGFAVACNQGAAAGQGELILFLNPDVTVDPGALDAAVSVLCGPDWPRAGIVGACLRDGDGVRQPTCARFPTWRSLVAGALGLDRLLPSVCPPHFLEEWDHGETRVVDQVMGAFFLVRRDVFAALGGFDERFFVYFEDLDFALRARRAGWQSVFAAAATAVHAGGGSSGQVPARRLFYWLRSRSLYARKHFGAARAGVLLAVALTVEPLARLVHGCTGGRRRDPRDVLAGYAAFVRWLLSPVRAVTPA